MEDLYQSTPKHVSIKKKIAIFLHNTNNIEYYQINVKFYELYVYHYCIYKSMREREKKELKIIIILAKYSLILY